MECINTGIEMQKDLDNIYPNRHVTIHKTCCKNCPSEYYRRNNITDMECEDIKATFCKEEIVNEFLFVCAWRPSKLCKGICDFYGIDQKFINTVLNK